VSPVLLFYANKDTFEMKKKTIKIGEKTLSCILLRLLSFTENEVICNLRLALSSLFKKKKSVLKANSSYLSFPYMFDWTF
jgi:hypothetical protein